MSGVLQQFVRTFFDENPLSQLGLVILRNGVAERLTELSSSPVRAAMLWHVCAVVCGPGLSAARAVVRPTSCCVRCARFA